jgi:hypothetical protein
VTHVTEHCCEFYDLPGANRSQRQTCIYASSLAQQLTCNHHVQTLADIVLMKDDVADYKLNALRRCIQEVPDCRRTR